MSSPHFVNRRPWATRQGDHGSAYDYFLKVTVTMNKET
jgi:hypothetical protein